MTSPDIISHELAATLMRDTAKVAGAYHAERTKLLGRINVLEKLLDAHATVFAAMPDWGRVGDLVSVSAQVGDMIVSLTNQGE